MGAKMTTQSTTPVKDIQGNILNPFGRPHAKYLFIQFTAEPTIVRARLHKLLSQLVTSAERQAEVTAEWKASGKKRSSQTVGMFGLSHEGLLTLERTAHVPLSPSLGLKHFEAGMRQPQPILWEPETDRWQREYRYERMDAFLLLCDDDLSRLEQATADARTQIEAFGKVIVEETGSAIEKNGDTYEPFGFRDGISGIPDPESASTPEVFTPEPGYAGGFGCYATFAKFEQHVKKFWQTAEAIETKAEAQGLSLSAEQVGALAVGRQRDGTALVPSGSKGNNFRFKDVSASTCPLHAHIRAVNSRDGLETFELIRRGIPYPGKGGGDPGLLFLSFERSPLEFIGMLYMAHRKFDPILSQSSQRARVAREAASKIGPAGGQRWPVAEKEISHEMTDLTTLRGGEHFYVPSMRFISGLGLASAAVT